MAVTYSISPNPASVNENTSGPGDAWLMTGFIPLTRATFGPTPGISWHIIAETG
jgi:hypothetical protein